MSADLIKEQLLKHLFLSKSMILSVSNIPLNIKSCTSSSLLSIPPSLFVFLSFIYLFYSTCS